MAKKRRIQPRGSMVNMTYKDLKAACIMKGMDLEDVSDADIHALTSFYHANQHVKSDRSKLEEYHEYMVDHLVNECGYDPDDPLVKFKEFAIDEDSGQLKRSIVKKGGGETRKPKRRRERDAKFNILKGTKKDHVFMLTKKAHTKGWEMKKAMSKVVERAKKEGIEAQEKSMKIWFKKAWKALE